MKTRIDWTAVWEKFGKWADREWREWPQQEKKIAALVEAQLVKPARRARRAKVRGA